MKVRDASTQTERIGVPEEHLSGHAFHTYRCGLPDQCCSMSPCNIVSPRLSTPLTKPYAGLGVLECLTCNSQNFSVLCTASTFLSTAVCSSYPIADVPPLFIPACQQISGWILTPIENLQAQISRWRCGICLSAQCLRKEHLCRGHCRCSTIFGKKGWR